MTTPTRVTDLLPDDRRDRKIIKLLLSHITQRRGQTWASLDFPEERIRSRDAVQVIAMEQSGRMTAVEHVALDGIARDTQTQEALRFMAAFAALERDASIRVPGFHIDIAIPVETLPNELDPKLLVTSARGWCERHVKTMAAGHATHVLMVSRTPIRIQVEKSACPGEPGRLSVARAQPPRNFGTVVYEKLEQKLARLVAAAADQRMLLFEKSDALWTLAQLRQELEGASLEFPELNAVTEVWLADTVRWESEGSVEFRLVLRNDDD